MEILSQRVYHPRFGFGTIREREGGTIRVNFEISGEHSFLYPDSFGGFLTACDADFARQAAEDLRVMDEERTQASLARVLALRESAKLAAPKPAAKKAAPKTRKPSQAVKSTKEEANP